MKYAIQILEQQLIKEIEFEEEEDDMIGAIISMRNELELKIAIKILKNALSLNTDLNQITWK